MLTAEFRRQLGALFSYSATSSCAYESFVQRSALKLKSDKQAQLCSTFLRIGRHL